MKRAGIDAVYGYLGVINEARRDFILAEGMAFMPVGLAGRFDGPATVQQLKEFDVTPLVTTCFDVEGLDAFHAIPGLYASKLNAGFDPVNAGGWTTGAYLGSPQPFTSAEQYALHCTHYWRGQGRIVDRDGNLAEPTCGWCVTQMYPSIAEMVDSRTGELIEFGFSIDIDVIGQDYKGRVPYWMRG